MSRQTPLTFLGDVELLSPWFSNEWRVRQGDREFARMRRFARLHVSRVKLANGADLILEPHGWGIVRAVDKEGIEAGRISRRSWTGRRWDITGTGFGYELISRPRPRAWSIAIGGAPIAEIAGSMASYNKVRVSTALSMPILPVLLAWHVIARPWEAAARPRGLVPVPRPVRRTEAAT